MSNEWRLPAGKKSERLVKGLLKPAKKRTIEESLPEVPDAAKVIESLEKKIVKLEQRVKLLESRTGKLWAAHVNRAGG